MRRAAGAVAVLAGAAVVLLPLALDLPFDAGLGLLLVAATGLAAGAAALVTRRPPVALALGAAGAAVAGTMATAATVHQPNGFFSTEGGLEYPAMLALVGASFAATGPGPISLDHALGHRLDRPWQRVAALVAIVPSVYAVVSRRRSALEQAPAQDTASA